MDCVAFLPFDFETPSVWAREMVLLLRIPEPFAACLDEFLFFTVVVRDGAIVIVIKLNGVVRRVW